MSSKTHAHAALGCLAPQQRGRAAPQMCLQERPRFLRPLRELCATALCHFGNPRQRLRRPYAGRGGFGTEAGPRLAPSARLHRLKPETWPQVAHLPPDQFSSLSALCRRQNIFWHLLAFVWAPRGPGFGSEASAISANSAMDNSLSVKARGHRRRTATRAVAHPICAAESRRRDDASSDDAQ